MTTGVQKSSASRIVLKLGEYSRDVKTYHTTKTKRFYAIVKAEKFQKAYVKVAYGKAKNNSGEIVDFYNDGIYETEEELIHAFKAFIDIDKPNTGNVPVKN